jgi:hypothetical protein
MAQHVNARRFYIDVDQSDDHTVIRRVPVRKASWVAPEATNSSLTSNSPATHTHIDPDLVRATPQRLGEMIRSVRKRQHHS